MISHARLSALSDDRRPLRSGAAASVAYGERGGAIKSYTGQTFARITGGIVAGLRYIGLPRRLPSRIRSSFSLILSGRSPRREGRGVPVVAAGAVSPRPSRRPLARPPQDEGKLSRSRLHPGIGALLVTAVFAFTSPGASAAEAKVLALGDSLVAGFGLPREDTFPVQLEARLRAEGYPAVVIDAGVSGDTSEGGRNRVGWVLDAQTDIAIVELGGNDGLRGLDPQVTRANLAAIIETLHEKDVAVILSGMLAPPNMGGEYGGEFNAVYPALAEAYDVIYDPFFLEGIAAQPSLNQADGIHPNAAGVAKIVERFWPIVARALVAELGAAAFPEGSALPPRETPQ